MSRTLGLPTSKATDLTAGTFCVVLGLASYVLSRGRDGFDKGLFQGATLALMVLGAYLLGSALRARRDTAGEGEDENRDDPWLPSRDGR